MYRLSVYTPTASGHCVGGGSDEFLMASVRVRGESQKGNFFMWPYTEIFGLL